jgi:hypothetical protein
MAAMEYGAHPGIVNVAMRRIFSDPTLRWALTTTTIGTILGRKANVVMVDAFIKATATIRYLTGGQCDFASGFAHGLIDNGDVNAVRRLLESHSNDRWQFIRHSFLTKEDRPRNQELVIKYLPRECDIWDNVLVDYTPLYSLILKHRQFFYDMWASGRFNGRHFMPIYEVLKRDDVDVMEGFVKAENGKHLIAMVRMMYRNTDFVFPKCLELMSKQFEYSHSNAMKNFISEINLTSID